MLLLCWIAKGLASASITQAMLTLLLKSSGLGELEGVIVQWDRLERAIGGSTFKVV
jgi:hypothetical protein